MGPVTAILAEPLYFPADKPSLFAWLHPARGPSVRNVGVVICPPFGYEALSAHRTIRALADVAAETGLPTLRFNYLGTGDSADIDPTADQIMIWTENVVIAVAELRRRTGVEKVMLLGIRLGALLAVLAGAKCPDVCGLLLVAPVVSGKRYLRELNTARLAAQLQSSGPDGSAQADRGPDPTIESGAREFSGYLMSATAIESLSRIDLAALPKPAAGQVLVLDRNDLPTAQAWSTAIGARYAALEGFVEMALVAPQFAVVPGGMVAAVRSWLQERTQPCTRPLAPLSDESIPTLPLSVSMSDVQGQLTESPVMLGDDVQIFGIVTSPVASHARHRGVILLNVGADLHIGASRMYVSLARKWAQSGYHVLRLDLAGLGDSATRRDSVIDEVFPRAALADIGVAIAFLRTRFGVGKITLAGLCSGAYHALRAAATRAPVDHIIMVNPQNYFWGEKDSLQGLQTAEVVHNPGIYRERLADSGAWKRLLSGKVNLWRIVQIYLFRQKLTVEATGRSIARLLHIRLARDLGRDLQDIVGRGTRVTFVFARGEPGLPLLQLEAGSLLDTLGAEYRLRLIERADHTFSQIGPRSTLERILSEEIYEGHARAAFKLQAAARDVRA